MRYFRIPPPIAVTKFPGVANPPPVASFEFSNFADHALSMIVAKTAGIRLYQLIKLTDELSKSPGQVAAIEDALWESVRIALQETKALADIFAPPFVDGATRFALVIEGATTDEPKALEHTRLDTIPAPPPEA
jgi:hypothetical protein